LRDDRVERIGALTEASDHLRCRGYKRARIPQKCVGVVGAEDKPECVVLFASPESCQMRGGGSNVAVEQARRGVECVAEVLLRDSAVLHQASERVAVDLDAVAAQTVGQSVAPVGEGEAQDVL